MIVPLTLSKKFSSYSPFIIRLGEKVKQSLMLYCERYQYAFTYRQKTLESLAEKIETGRFQSWSDIDDFFACTIIIPTLADEQQVVDHCKEQFNVLRTIKRGQTRKSPDVFRFDSTRMTCRLHRPEGLESVGLTIYDINFEVQIRSAFEHAWSVTTHALSYKTDAVDWKRLRLAAQIKASVEQLDMLIMSFEQNVPFVSENPWPEMKAKKKIATVLNESFKNGVIPSELIPKDISRFCDNIYGLLATNGKNDVSAFVEFLSKTLKSFRSDSIPRSVSLFQFVLGILVDSGFIGECTPERTYHVTSELIDIFPKSSYISSPFDYEQ